MTEIHTLIRTRKPTTESEGLMERIRVDPILQATGRWSSPRRRFCRWPRAHSWRSSATLWPNTNAGLALVLIIVAAASTGIRWAGIAAALASAAGFDYFLTEPYSTFVITDRADIETAVLLLVGSAVTEIALWGRRVQSRASREQGYLDGLSAPPPPSRRAGLEPDLIDVFPADHRRPPDRRLPIRCGYPFGDPDRRG